MMTTDRWMVLRQGYGSPIVIVRSGFSTEAAAERAKDEIVESWMKVHHQTFWTEHYIQGTLADVAAIRGLLRQDV